MMEMYTRIEEELIYEPCTWGHACEGLHTVSEKNCGTDQSINQVFKDFTEKLFFLRKDC